MIATLIFSVVSVFLTLGLLFLGTFFLIFLERFVGARVQHRDGAGLGGKVHFLQVWEDFIKVRASRAHVESIGSLRFKIAFFLWPLLPPFFLILLFSGLIPDGLRNFELFFLLLLPLLAAALEAVFTDGSRDEKEKLEWKKKIFLRILGVAGFFLGIAPVALHTGVRGLAAVSELQLKFPFHLILTGPGLFVCAIASFFSIYLYANGGPIKTSSQLSLGRSRHYLIFFTNKMWVFCLLSFWVFLFLGGDGNIVQQLLLPLRIIAILLAFTVIQVSLPQIRSTDAAEISFRWMFRLSLLGVLLEAIWMGVRG